MATSEENIKKDIKAYIDKVGGYYSTWYVGIATNAEDRLFNDHNVNKQNGNWIYSTAINDDVSRRVEEYFIDIVGTDGGKGGGDENTKMVYAYEKTSNTKR